MINIKNKKCILLSTLLIIFIILSILIKSNNIEWLDSTRNLFEVTNTKTTFFKFITEFGDVLVLTIIMVISLVLIKQKKYGMLLGVNLIASAGVSKILKHIFLRKRPTDMLIEQGGYSFPSGHSFVSLAFYGLIIYLITKSTINEKYKKLIILLLIILILLIGLSRIYLKVHFPSDVVGGFTSGLIYLIIFIEIIKRIEGEVHEKK